MEELNEEQLQLARDLCACYVEYSGGYADGLLDARATAKKLNEIGYRKQQKGQWIERRWTTDDDWGCFNHRSIKCSVCGIEIYKGEPTEYCPHCGAEMEEMIGRG